MLQRNLLQIIASVPTSDGGGVKLRRSLGQHQRFDPFLMLDEFSSEEASDYIAGFPPHPHRGFETVTYMLDGHMLHEDHLGNKGHLRSGGAQWMTAGRGIIHSEMPQQESGRMRGFQLWVNLPAAEKMKPAHYRDIAPEEIPSAALAAGRIRIVAGTLDIEGRILQGPIQGGVTDPIFVDIRLEAGQQISLPLPAAHHAFVYPYEGQLAIGVTDDRKVLSEHAAGILSEGERVLLAAPAKHATAFLVIAGRPLNEPIAQYGPFVMNTAEEIEQAVQDYRNGRLTETTSATQAA